MYGHWAGIFYWIFISSCVLSCIQQTFVGNRITLLLCWNQFTQFLSLAWTQIVWEITQVASNTTLYFINLIASHYKLTKLTWSSQRSNTTNLIFTVKHYCRAINYTYNKQASTFPISNSFSFVFFTALRVLPLFSLIGYAGCGSSSRKAQLQ